MAWRGGFQFRFLGEFRGEDGGWFTSVSPADQRRSMSVKAGRGVARAGWVVERRRRRRGRRVFGVGVDFGRRIVVVLRWGVWFGLVWWWEVGALAGD